MSNFASSIMGNTQWLDGGAMFGNVPRAMWERWVDVDDRHRIKLACRALLIQSEHGTYLCETGIGSFFEPKLADRFGVVESDHRLRHHLAAAGIAESDIDYVILSHLHFDHAGGLLPGRDDPDQDQLLFPKARYVVGAEAWDRALHPHSRDRASFLPDLNQRLIDSGRLLVVDGDRSAELPHPGLSFRYSHGHTPGQMHACFKGDQYSIVFAGDLIPGVPWIHLPITMGYDRFAEQVIDEKRALYADITDEDWLVFFTHDSHHAAANVVQGDKGRYQAGTTWAEWQRFAF